MANSPKLDIRKIAEACPLARRPHTCSVCGHPIAIGSRYGRIVAIQTSSLDRKPSVFKFHKPACPPEMLP